LESFEIDVVCSENIFKTGKNLSLPATIEDRLSDLNVILKDDSIDLMISTRGGYGSGQLLEYINWELFKRSKIPLLGYSDISAIQLASMDCGNSLAIASPVAQELVDVCDSQIAAEGLKRAIEALLRNPQDCIPTPLLDIIPLESIDELNVIKSGFVSGGIVPVNLSIFTSLIGSKYMPDMTNRILLIEDIDEPIYKIDRMLTQIKHNSIFAKCAALCFGDFKNCEDRKALDVIFAKFAKFVNGPVISGIPFGHTFPTLSFTYNEQIKLDI
jgi:muramoyltetrapeptide carboxypeptidase